MKQKFLSMKELTTRFGVTRSTIYHWLDSPDIALPAPVQIGNRKYFDIQKVEEWEVKNTKANNKAA